MKSVIIMLAVLSLLFSSCDNSNDSDKFVGKWQELKGYKISPMMPEEENFKFIISRNEDERVIVKYGAGTYYSVIFISGDDWNSPISKILYEYQNGNLESGDSKLYFIPSSGHLMDDVNHEYKRVQ